MNTLRISTDLRSFLAVQSCCAGKTEPRDWLQRWNLDFRCQEFPKFLPYATGRIYASNGFQMMSCPVKIESTDVAISALKCKAFAFDPIKPALRRGKVGDRLVVALPLDPDTDELTTAEPVQLSGDKQVPRLLQSHDVNDAMAKALDQILTNNDWSEGNTKGPLVFNPSFLTEAAKYLSTDLLNTGCRVIAGKDANAPLLIEWRGFDEVTHILMPMAW